MAEIGPEREIIEIPRRPAREPVREPVREPAKKPVPV